jgi:predicted RNA binding protein YcfA (HicA-like mRNA interferase family)
LAKAARVLAALKRDGWVEIRRRGSHRTLLKGGVKRTFAYHDPVDLGGAKLSQVARYFGYTLAELRRMV